MGHFHGPFYSCVPHSMFAMVIIRSLRVCLEIYNGMEVVVFGTKHVNDNFMFIWNGFLFAVIIDIEQAGTEIRLEKRMRNRELNLTSVLEALTFNCPHGIPRTTTMPIHRKQLHINLALHHEDGYTLMPEPIGNSGLKMARHRLMLLWWPQHFRHYEFWMC